MAKATGMDLGALNRAFKLEYGLGMYHYLIRARFERARELLLEGVPIKK